MSESLRVRIAQVGNWYGGGGGVQNYMRDLGVALRAAGHSVAVVSDGPPGEVDHPEGWREYQIPRLADCHRIVRLGSVGREVARALDRIRPDVAYVHNMLEPGAAAELVLSTPTVFFHHTHDLYCPAGSKLLQRSNRECRYRAGAACVVQAFRERCHSRRPMKLARGLLRMTRARRWARRVDGLVVDTRHMRDRLVEEGFAADRIAVLPTPIRIPDTVAELPAGSGPPQVLFAGRLTPHKGLRYLLEAMTIGRVPYQLVVAGEGYRADELKALSHRLGLASRVEFVGWQGMERMSGLYRSAATVVVPSVWPEPFGMIGPEAMAHGRPVVAFDVGGIPEWLEDGRTGFLVPPRDTRSLAGRIDLLLSDPVLAAEMGRAARARAVGLFSHERHVAGLCGVLESAIRRRAAA